MVDLAKVDALRGQVGDDLVRPSDHICSELLLLRSVGPDRDERSAFLKSTRTDERRSSGGRGDYEISLRNRELGVFMSDGVGAPSFAECFFPPEGP